MALQVRGKKGKPGEKEFQCPGCGQYAAVTAEQLAGAAAFKCPNTACSFVATVDIDARIAAAKDAPAETEGEA